MSITIKDIAREGGVSIATVSRAINREAGLSPKTRQRILELASRLHYHPNFSARSLVGKKPEALGIVIPQTSEFALSNPYYNELLKGVGARSNESGYYLVLSFLRGESTPACTNTASPRASSFWRTGWMIRGWKMPPPRIFRWSSSPEIPAAKGSRASMETTGTGSFRPSATSGGWGTGRSLFSADR